MPLRKSSDRKSFDESLRYRSRREAGALADAVVAARDQDAEGEGADEMHEVPKPELGSPVGAVPVGGEGAEALHEAVVGQRGMGMAQLLGLAVFVSVAGYGVMKYRSRGAYRRDERMLA